MKNRKKEIVEVARTLFNTKGYSNVTIRMIAMELGMSSGNLNYHFKKKEAILETLYFNMVAVFDARVQALGDSHISLKSIREDMFISMKRMVAYRFFWTDLYNLLQQNTKIKAHFLEAYTTRYKGCELLFSLLIGKGMMKHFVFKEEQHFLIERMINYGNTWLYSSFMYDVEINDSMVKTHLDVLFGMLYPYFTDVAAEEYKKLYPHFFI